MGCGGGGCRLIKWMWDEGGWGGQILKGGSAAALDGRAWYGWTAGGVHKLLTTGQQ